MQSTTYSIDQDEMVEFARRWDPVPIHIDPDAAAAIGGVTASGTYVLAVKSRLLHESPEAVAIFGSAGYDEVRFTSLCALEMLSMSSWNGSRFARHVRNRPWCREAAHLAGQPERRDGDVPSRHAHRSAPQLGATPELAHWLRRLGNLGCLARARTIPSGHHV